MSRAGYTDDCDDQWRQIMWRGTVASAIRGKRGQAFLREMIEALDAMPEKRLVPNELVQAGEFCAIGSVGAKRGVEMEALDPYDPAQIAEAFGIAAPLVREIEFENDEAGPHDETPEGRWHRMRSWAERHLNQPAPTA